MKIYVMAIPGCQLAWNYNPEMESTFVIWILRQKDNMLLIQALKLDNTCL